MNATEIIPGLWQGGQMLPFLDRSYGAVVDMRLLEDMALPLDPATFNQNGPLLLWCPMVDAPVMPDQLKVTLCAFFCSYVIDEIKGRTVLVHCAEGFNRSGLVVATFLVLCRDMKPDDAIALIQQKRPGALSNQTFCEFIRGLRK
jgi:protein-tyrosine phosphatase